ncbi:hypothetical protein ACWD4G_41810 [Streptomyces sp. NPDC002643]
MVPKHAGTASELVVFERNTPYVTPRPELRCTETKRRLFHRDPEAMAAHHSKAEALGHLERQVEDPALRAN